MQLMLVGKSCFRVLFQRIWVAEGSSSEAETPGSVFSDVVDSSPWRPAVTSEVDGAVTSVEILLILLLWWWLYILYSTVSRGEEEVIYLQKENKSTQRGKENQGRRQKVQFVTNHLSSSSCVWRTEADVGSLTWKWRAEETTTWRVTVTVTHRQPLVTHTLHYLWKEKAATTKQIKGRWIRSNSCSTLLQPRSVLSCFVCAADTCVAH